jgi:pimeloyl-ACP methyl ester carboxylesterase
LPGGQVLGYAIYGDRSATTTIFFNHGLPGCYIEALGYDTAACRYKLRIIAVNRPGFGGSTPVPDRRLLDWPADLLRLADELQVERFGVLGVSGGVPYTLACLREIPRIRCIGGGVVAGLYPVSLGLAGMMLQGQLLLAWRSGYPGWWRRLSTLIWEAAARTHPEKLEKQLTDSLQFKPEPDCAVWEIYLAASECGFTLDELAVYLGRLVTWHGAQDVNAPVAMAKKAHVLIKGSEMRVSEVDGHLSMSLGSFEEVVETMSRILSD